jgi:microcystin-dependent protein
LGARLGATYGGNGITTFAVPSLDEKFIRGTELEAELGDEAGSDTVTLQTANLPAHTHDYGYPSVGVDVEAPGVPDFTAVGNPPTTLQTSSVGDGDSFSVTNPYLKLRPIIRALGDTVVEIEIPVLPAVPVGATILWWGAPPTGWLDCSGQNISKTTYPELFAVIGYTYGGSGDTFNLPNTAGRTVFGLYPDLPPFGQFGDTGGEVEHALTAAEMPAHAHNVRLNLADGTSPQVPSLTTNRSPATNFGQTQSAGDGDPHNNMPPFITGGFIIKITP